MIVLKPTVKSPPAIYVVGRTFLTPRAKVGGPGISRMPLAITVFYRIIRPCCNLLLKGGW
jgi:hypothetical protein